MRITIEDKDLVDKNGYVVGPNIIIPLEEYKRMKSSTNTERLKEIADVLASLDAIKFSEPHQDNDDFDTIRLKNASVFIENRIKASVVNMLTTRLGIDVDDKRNAVLKEIINRA